MWQYCLLYIHCFDKTIDFKFNKLRALILLFASFVVRNRGVDRMKFRSGQRNFWLKIEDNFRQNWGHFSSIFDKIHKIHLKKLISKKKVITFEKSARVYKITIYGRNSAFLASNWYFFLVYYEEICLIFRYFSWNNIQIHVRFEKSRTFSAFPSIFKIEDILFIFRFICRRPWCETIECICGRCVVPQPSPAHWGERTLKRKSI